MAINISAVVTESLQEISTEQECLQKYANYSFSDKMAEEPAATLNSQFFEFAKYGDNNRDGSTITLYRSDFWMRQAKLIDDRKFTMTDTGSAFYKFSKSELNWDEWNEYLTNLIELKGLDEEEVKEILTNCGLPGQSPVVVPQYRDFFLTYKPKEKNPAMNVAFCNATFDSYLCWPPTRENTVIHQSCPRVRLSDPSNFAYRRCGVHGLWLGRRSNESSAMGWTNFTPCFPTELQSLFEEVFDAKNSTQSKYDIAQITRLIELSGFFASALALIISLGIFSKFRVLRNQRTLIHKCMFWTILAQSLVRIFIYLDQMYFRGTLQRNDIGIEHENNICIICYCVLEYIITATIVWHFIEGVCLFEYVHRNVMRPSFYFRRFFLFGWGIPAIITLAWALTNIMYYRAEKIKICWYGYNFLPTYWICQLPRFIIIVINFFFLIGVMRTIIQKLNIASNTELERCRRTVKAAMILIPLLGIPNILNMIDAPLNLNNWQFALWMYSTHFLISYQGMFIACIYCFANREVQNVIERTWRNARSQPRPGVFVIPTHGSRNSRPSQNAQNGQNDINTQEPRAARADGVDGNEDDVVHHAQGNPGQDRIGVVSTIPRHEEVARG